MDGHQNEATVDLAQDDGMKWDDDDYTHARGNRMEFSLGSTGSTMGAPPRVHPPGASGLRLEFGSMGSTKAEKLIGTGTCGPFSPMTNEHSLCACLYGKIGSELMGSHLSNSSRIWVKFFSPVLKCELLYSFTRD